MAVATAVLEEGLSKTLDGSSFESLGERYEGKVRDNYTRDGRRTIIVTDRISAFDWVLPTPIPDKGRVLTQLSTFWFDFI